VVRVVPARRVLAEGAVVADSQAVAAVVSAGVEVVAAQVDEVPAEEGHATGTEIRHLLGIARAAPTTASPDLCTINSEIRR
jgi:hypothetical protein